MASFLSSLSFLPLLPKLHPSSQTSHSPIPRTLPSPSQKILLSPATTQSLQSETESVDWIASSVTRRFGIGAGLACVGCGFLFESYQKYADIGDFKKEKEVVLANGIRFYEIKAGGGAAPKQGDLVVLDIQGKLQGNGEVFIDTFAREKRSLALVMGSRPYSKGMCEGVECALNLMKTGGEFMVTIPPILGFGDKGVNLDKGIQIPPSSTLEFVVQVHGVSTVPSA